MVGNGKIRELNPSAEELCEIALTVTDSCGDLLGTELIVALLFYSTKGSAK